MAKDRPIAKFCECGQKAILRWREKDVCYDCLFPDDEECQYEPQLLSCHLGHVEDKLDEQNWWGLDTEGIRKRLSQYLDAKEEGKVFEIKTIVKRKSKINVARRVKRGLPINLKENK